MGCGSSTVASILDRGQTGGRLLPEGEDVVDGADSAAVASTTANISLYGASMAGEIVKKTLEEKRTEILSSFDRDSLQLSRVSASSLQSGDNQTIIPNAVTEMKGDGTAQFEALKLPGALSPKGGSGTKEVLPGVEGAPESESPDGPTMDTDVSAPNCGSIAIAAVAIREADPDYDDNDGIGMAQKPRKVLHDGFNKDRGSLPAGAGLEGLRVERHNESVPGESSGNVGKCARKRSSDEKSHDDVTDVPTVREVTEAAKKIDDTKASDHSGISVEIDERLNAITAANKEENSNEKDQITKSRSMENVEDGPKNQEKIVTVEGTQANMTPAKDEETATVATNLEAGEGSSKPTSDPDRLSKVVEDSGEPSLTDNH